MSISNDLISEFVKLTNDKPETPKSTTAYGTVVESDGSKWVRLDGSPDGLLTPIETTTEVSQDDRVIVDIKDHTAIVTGNLTQPSVSTKTTDKIGSKISEFELIVAYKVNADDINAVNGYFENLKSIVGTFKNISTEDLETINASIVYLESKYADIDSLTTDDVKALNAEIENLKSTFASIESISTNELDAAKASIDQLSAYNANFTYVLANELSALKANINQLNVDKLDVNWANIDSANIDIARIGDLFAKSGIISNITTETGIVTGELVGVTIKGDLIDANTIVADKLVVLGKDGIYYKLNVEAGTFLDGEEVPMDGLHGSVLTANSITADKVSVRDLVAFGATIGGFNITDYSLYSNVKDSEGNTIRGIYLDNDGQFNFGDSNNYVKFEKDETEQYKLMISADSILYNINGEHRSISELGELGEYVHIGNYEGEPCIELGESDSDFKLVITNTRILFKEGAYTPAYINNRALNIDKAIIEDELQIGDSQDDNQSGTYVWQVRSNGNMGLRWIGTTEVVR